MKAYSFTIEELEKEAFSPEELRELHQGRLCHRQRIEQDHPHLWEILTNPEKNDCLPVSNPKTENVNNLRKCESPEEYCRVLKEEEKKKLQDPAYQIQKPYIDKRMLNPINGIKLYTNKGRTVCAVTAMIKYRDNPNSTIYWRGDHRRENENLTPAQMADNIREALLERRYLIKKAIVYYNPHGKRKIFQILRDGKLVNDHIDAWKIEMGFASALEVRHKISPKWPNL